MMEGRVPNFFEKYEVAKQVISQLKNNEWNFRYNDLLGSCVVAERGNYCLWVGNGPMFFEIELSSPYLEYSKYYRFGYFWRHYVWWMAARKAKKDADLKNKK